MTRGGVPTPASIPNVAIRDYAPSDYRPAGCCGSNGPNITDGSTGTRPLEATIPV